jgi:GT2 family glycosyltransferase/glycosyltransferase involved in cell wall biosynthesis
MNDFLAGQILLAIPSINGGELLGRMLPTLRFPSAQVVVLDQGSRDETDRVCAENGVHVVQLGRPHTYTQACNIAAQMARDRGCKYVCVANNDITFRTNVLQELAAEMERDTTLGIIAPSQMIVDETLDSQPVSYRVLWQLRDVDFLHDTRLEERATQRLESDFCELTCALIRLSAIDEIGFLDDEYGFYHEDADFGFRLRKAGFNCAYLPQSQIVHYSSSTINREKQSIKSAYIAKNKGYFARKHLGYGVKFRSTDPSLGDEWVGFGEDLQRYLHNYGLADDDRPDLVVGYPGTSASAFLYTPFCASELPSRWLTFGERYRAIFTTNAPMKALFQSQGLRYSYDVPPGVETDKFQPWGTTRRLHDTKTYLVFADGYQTRFLNVVLTAWRRSLSVAPNSRLVILGQNLTTSMGRAADRVFCLDNIEVAEYQLEKIEFYKLLAPLSAADQAELFRAVDYTLVSARKYQPTLAAIQSLACGTPCLVVDCDGPGWVGFPEFFRTSLSAPFVAANTTAPWFEGTSPLEERIADFFSVFDRTSDADRRRLAITGIDATRAQHTLRHTAMGLYRALACLQIRSPSQTIARLEARQAQQAAAGAEDAAPIQPPALSWRGQLTRLIARRVGTLGRLTSEFSTLWLQIGLVAATRTFIKRGPKYLRRMASGAPLGQLRQTASGRLERPGSNPVIVPNSALLIGYIDAQLGLGESLRGLALAMSYTDVAFRIYPFGIGVEGRRGAAYMADRYDLDARHAVNIIEVGTIDVGTVIQNLGRAYFSDSYNVLRTYWELGRAPEAWRPHLQDINEIWAPDDFVAESFRTIFDGPITIVPPCIHLPAITINGHVHFGLDPNRFYFLFAFDYFSFPQRKNPLAVLRAFQNAFPDASTKVGLIVKSTGASTHFPAIRQALRVAARDDSRIQIIDESLSRDEMLALLAATDCYTSLHRSEGFGLSLAEAMALGKPVIGTDYSGNTDFLNHDTGYPIPYTLEKIRRGDYIFETGQVWAHPDEAASTAAMLHVYNNRNEAMAKAAAGQKLIDHRYGLKTVGQIARNRLREIFSQPRAK